MFGKGYFHSPWREFSHHRPVSPLLLDKGILLVAQVPCIYGLLAWKPIQAAKKHRCNRCELSSLLGKPKMQCLVDCIAQQEVSCIIDSYDNFVIAARALVGSTRRDPGF